MSFSDIPTRSNGTTILADWFNTIKTQLTTKFAGVVDPAASSLLDISSTTKGTRPYPSMTTTQRNAISSPANGLIIYNTTSNTLNLYTGSSWSQISIAADAADITNYLGYTPTSTGFTNASLEVDYRRVRNTIIVQGAGVFSGVATADLQIDLPSGISFSNVPAASGRSRIGWIVGRDGGGGLGQNYNGVVEVLDSNTVGFRSLEGVAADNGPWNTTTPITWGSGDEIHFQFEAQTTGW